MTEREIIALAERILRTRTPAMRARLERRFYEAVKARRDPASVITVRVPESLHEKLKEQAHRSKVSLNTLCVNRLTGGE